MRRIAAACAVVWAGAAIAAEEAPMAEDLFFGELPLVLTASRIAQSPLDAPAPVTVIDRETIRASGMTEIHDILRLAPGFLVADWPKGGPMVANHGLGDAYSKRLLVLVDGYSVLDAAFASVHWQDLHVRLEDVERIEVARGPNQASFGANAYQGIVNVITRGPGTGEAGAAILAYGEHGFHDLYGRFGNKTDNLAWRISASSRQATNFRDLEEHDYRYDEQIERRTLHGQLVYRASMDTEWRASFGLSRGVDDVGSIYESLTFPEHARKNHSTFAQVAWTKHYAPDSELSLQYFHLERSSDESYIYQQPPLASPIDYATDVRRDDLELEHIHAFSDSLKGVWGVGVRRDEVESPRYFYGLGSVAGTQWQAFGNLDWRFRPDWLLHAGGMIESHYTTDALFSPRLALNYYPSPLQSIRVSAGRGYRAPSMLEARAREVFVYQGDYTPLQNKIVDLGSWAEDPVKPESIAFVEAGYVARLPDRHLQLDARVFHERHAPFIDALVCKLRAPAVTQIGLGCDVTLPADYMLVQRTDNVFVPHNIGSARLTGADLTLDWRHPVLGRFLFSHAVTQIKASIVEPDTERDAEQSAPHQSTSLLWSKHFAGGVRTSLGVYRLGAMKWMGDGDPQAAYTRVDLRLGKALGKPGGEDEIALTVQNLDGGHQEFRDVFTVERTAFVTLRLGW